MTKELMIKWLEALHAHLDDVYDYATDTGEDPYPGAGLDMQRIKKMIHHLKSES